MIQLIFNGKPFNGTEEEFLAIKKFFVKCWVLNGKLHRVGGPAIIYSDRKREYQEGWYKNGERHRTDGPLETSLIGGPRFWYFEDFNLAYLFPISEGCFRRVEGCEKCHLFTSDWKGRFDLTIWFGKVQA